MPLITNDSWQQIEKIRNHVITIFKALTISIIALYPFNKELYQILAEPLQLNAGQTIIATKVVSPFTIPIKLCIFCSIIICMPIILWQLWQFLRPAMHNNEKAILRYILLFGTSLFFLGILFGFEYVLPKTINVFQGLTPKNVVYMPDMEAYLDFSLSIIIAFGFCFQVPVILISLIKFGVLSVESLAKYRKHVVVACFVIGMLLTPPDITSQIMMALPMWALFELSLLIARFI